MFTWFKKLANSEAKDYEKRFLEALKRSKDWRLEPPCFRGSKERFASEQNQRIYEKVVSDHISHCQAEEVSQQCFAITLALKAPLEQALGVPLLVTLGYVELDGNNVFYTDTQELKMMINKGMPSPALNLHAWLTLPSLEVIDITFGTTYGVVRNAPEFIGRMCFMHPDDMTPGMQYHPQLIGETYLKRIGGLHELLVFN